MTGLKVEVNGGASQDVLSLVVSGNPTELEAGMRLAYALLTQPKIEKAVFDNWKTRQEQVIRQTKLNPQGRFRMLLENAIYPEGEARVRMLTEEQLAGVELADAQSWLEKQVAQSPIEVAIVGDISLEKARGLAAKYLGSLPERPRIDSTTHASRRDMPRKQGPIEATEEMTTRTPQAMVLGGFFGADASNLRDSRMLDLAARVLSTRMIDQVREKEQLVYSIRASSSPAQVYPGYGMFFAAAPTDAEKIDRLKAKLHEMFAEFAKTGPTPEELEVAKKQVANQLDESMKDPAYWTGTLATMTYRGRMLDDVQAMPGEYQKATADEIRETFARYYKPETSMSLAIKPLPLQNPAPTATDGGK
jgi:zinc protease